MKNQSFSIALAIMYFISSFFVPSAFCQDQQMLPQNTFAAHDGPVNAAVFSPNGEYVLTGSSDKTVRLWQPENDESKIVFTASSEITALAVSPNGINFAAGTKAGIVSIHYMKSGNKIREIKAHSAGVSSIAYSPDGGRLLTGAGEFDGSAKVWDTNTGDLLQTFTGHKRDVRSVVFSSDGTKALTGGGTGYPSYQGEAKLWDVQTGNVLATFESGSDYVFDAVFTPDETAVLIAPDYILSANLQIARLFDVETTASIKTFPPNTADLRSSAHSNEITSIDISPDASLLVTGSTDKTIKLWDMNTGGHIYTFPAHDHFVNSVVFSPDGKSILSGSDDGTAKLWNIVDVPPTPTPTPVPTSTPFPSSFPRVDPGDLITTTSDFRIVDAHRLPASIYINEERIFFDLQPAKDVILDASRHTTIARNSRGNEIIVLMNFVGESKIVAEISPDTFGETGLLGFAQNTLLVRLDLYPEDDVLVRITGNWEIDLPATTSQFGVDLNRDGKVDRKDLIYFQKYWYR